MASDLSYDWRESRRRLAGDTARQATSPEVRDLRAESAALKEAVADLTLENRLLKKARSRNHPQTQGKIERWHQVMKNRVLLENYYLPGAFERAVEAFVEHYILGRRSFMVTFNGRYIADVSHRRLAVGHSSVRGGWRTSVFRN